LQKYVYLKLIAQKLSRDKRSVAIVDGILEAAFDMYDVEMLREMPE